MQLAKSGIMLPICTLTEEGHGCYQALFSVCFENTGKIFRSGAIFLQ
jgi:hypothetical protein